MSNIDNLHLLHMICQNFGFGYSISQVMQNQSPTSLLLVMIIKYNFTLWSYQF
jgi:hypothetical protein